MASNFHPIEFPAGLAFGAGCGVQFETELTLLASGHEIAMGAGRAGDAIMF